MSNVSILIPPDRHLIPLLQSVPPSLPFHPREAGGERRMTLFPSLLPHFLRWKEGGRVWTGLGEERKPHPTPCPHHSSLLHLSPHHAFSHASTSPCHLYLPPPTDMHYPTTAFSALCTHAPAMFSPCLPACFFLCPCLLPFTTTCHLYSSFPHGPLSPLLPSPLACYPTPTPGGGHRAGSG